ncbi:MAG: DUF4474 domain-containing protein [Clostridia bacterium]|nr:DUF4474 domain-containing protein [Clostridia bacterium]
MMKKSCTRVLAIFLVILTLGSMLSLTVAMAADDAKGDAPAVSISATDIELTIYQKVTLTAEVTGVSGEPKLKWKSNKPLVATVNQKGVVTGLSVGVVTITVTAKADGLTLTDSIELFVVQPQNAIHNFLRDKQVLSYKYSYKDDYYYTNDKQCWQQSFGFSKFYDLVAPYILLEYDYVRVYFTYAGKDWMIQLWKGQYGMVFYGAETGVYTKNHTGKEPGVFTVYQCAKEDDWLNMDMTMYHDTTGLGTYQREFTRDYGRYWWCTGFKRGHLRVNEPARELRTTGTITMKDGEMTRLFTEGLIHCGFTELDRGADLKPDTFWIDGNDVHYMWQNISHAETTMPIKAMAVATFLAPLLGPAGLVTVFFLDIGLLLLAIGG